MNSFTKIIGSFKSFRNNHNGTDGLAILKYLRKKNQRLLTKPNTHSTVVFYQKLGTIISFGGLNYWHHNNHHTRPLSCWKGMCNQSLLYWILYGWKQVITLSEPPPMLVPPLKKKSQNPFTLFLNITNIPCFD